MVHPGSSAGSRVTLTEYVQQMGTPATFVAKFVGEKNVKANMCDRSNQTRAHNIHLATRAMHNLPTNKTTARKSPMTVIAVNNAKMMIDTGASVNVMDERTYEMIRKPALMRHKGPRIMPYGGGTPLNVLGVCDVTLESKSAIQCHRFHVTKGAHGSLIGFSTAQELGLVNSVNKIGSNWEDKYPGLTKGTG